MDSALTKGFGVVDNAIIPIMQAKKKFVVAVE
jgi:hypothetical protein